MQGLASREGQQLPGEVGRAICLRADLQEFVLQVAAIFGGSNTNVGPSHNGADHVVEIVRHTASEPSDRFEPLQLMYLLLQSLPLLALFRFPELPLHGGNQTAEVGLHQVVLRTNFQRGDRRIFPNGAGDKNERNIQSFVADELQGIGAAEVGHAVIGDDDVPHFIERLEQAVRRIDAFVEDVVAALSQDANLQFRVVFRIFNKKNAERSEHLRSPEDGRSFVQDQPVQSELPHGFNKFVEFDRLANKAIGAQVVAAYAVLVLIGSSEDDNGEKLRCFVGAHPIQNFKAVHFREFQVKQDNLRHHAQVATGVCARIEKAIEGFAPVARHNNFIANIVLLQPA